MSSLNVIFCKLPDGSVDLKDNEVAAKTKSTRDDNYCAKKNNICHCRKPCTGGCEKYYRRCEQSPTVQLLGQHKMEWGKFTGKTFHWVLTHATGVRVARNGVLTIAAIPWLLFRNGCQKTHNRNRYIS